MLEGETTGTNWAEVIKTLITVLGTVVTLVIAHLLNKWSKKDVPIEKPTTELEVCEPEIQGSFSGVLDRHTREAFEILDKRITANIECGNAMREAMVGMQRQITANRAFENAFRNIQPIACWISNSKGEFTFVSQEFSRIVGLDRMELLKNGWVENLAPEYQKIIYTEWREAVEQQRGFSSVFEFIHKNGGRVKVECKARGIEENGAMVYIGVLTEIKENA